MRRSRSIAFPTSGRSIVPSLVAQPIDVHPETSYPRAWFSGLMGEHMANIDVDQKTPVEIPPPANVNGKSTNGAGGHSDEAKPTDTTVGSFKIGDVDGAGRVIHDIYFKRTTYVIYCTIRGTEKQVLVQYATILGLRRHKSQPSPSSFHCE